MTAPVLMAEVAFGTGASTSTWLHLDDPTRGKLDTATLGPDVTEVWSDVTPYLRSVSTVRGSRRVGSPLITYEAGNGVIELNDPDRRFDPDNLAGPYVSGGETQVTPMRAVRVRAVHNGTSYDILRGYARDWQTVYVDNVARAVVPFADGQQVLEKAIRAASGAVGAGEDAGARVNRILDSAGWSATDRLVSTGNTTLQATTLEGSALAELQLVAETEIGELYFDAAGRVVFRNRNAILTDTRSTVSQGTFGDAGTEHRYADITPTYDIASLFNSVMITREGGTVQTAQDSTSITKYLIRAYEKDGLLMETDDAALDYARFILHVAKDPERRFATLTIRPHGDPDDLWPQVLGREIGDRITVIRRPPGGGDPIERDAFIRGIAHDIPEATEDWTTTWLLQSATKYSFLILDHATLGQLDSNALAY